MPAPVVATVAGTGAASARRGRLEVTLERVPGSEQLTGWPKYVTVRHNRREAGKAPLARDGRFASNALAPLDNVSGDDALVVRIALTRRVGRPADEPL